MSTGRPDVTVEDFEVLDRVAPDHLRVELINGRVIVTSFPDGDHGEDITEIDDQIRLHHPHLRTHRSCADVR
ncbi:Uma2 family endonuclease [Sphaerisporangium fuscum]|uniref:Uma2 family endonuclease n=1 Tax=Sphaerisporangium fuscum TaxID=2835868 RepID=UPI001BDD8BDD|nr:Uma2 family endonuclease [Sphaerisporangium fuscum]